MIAIKLQRMFGLLSLVLAGCASLETTPPTAIHQPMSVRPEPRTAQPPANGAIFQQAYSRPLFEDRRARFVGDIITVRLEETTSAKKASSADASRTASTDAGVTALAKVPLAGLNSLSASASDKSSFGGKGDAAANNEFKGTITVTVIDVLPNGNLLVSGEKQIAINQGNEFIRFSGVVNPVSISTSNDLSSTQVADARIEYKGSGYIDEAQKMGWLQRFFLNVLPF